MFNKKSYDKEFVNKILDMFWCTNISCYYIKYYSTNNFNISLNVDDITFVIEGKDYFLRKGIQITLAVGKNVFITLLKKEHKEALLFCKSLINKYKYTQLIESKEYIKKVEIVVENATKNLLKGE